MNGHHIRLNTSSKHEKTKSIYYEKLPHQIEYITISQKHMNTPSDRTSKKQKAAYIMEGHVIKLNTSSKHKKIKSIYYERYIKLNTSSKPEKTKAYIMNGHHIRLNTSSKH